MEENENPTMLAFDSPQSPTFIKVIGVGGGGGNAVNHMYRQGIQGVDFIVCNTDAQALQASPVPTKIAIGKGLGAGGRAERAKAAALERADEIREIFSHNTQMLFITAGMGGGTGTGAAPVIAEIAKSIDLEDSDTPKILVVAIVTMPFSFEGRRRREQAELGIAELRKHVDSILIINNDKLRTFGDMTINNAFSKADDVLLTAAKGIAEIITVHAYVNVDFQDVNTVMENSGTALMGAGVAKGEDRAMEAIKAASSSVLLNDDNIHGAKYVLLYFAFNSEHPISMDEIDAVTNYLTQLTGNECEEVIWGMGDFDELEGDEMKITLIATGFEKTKTQIPNSIAYEKPIMVGPNDAKSEVVQPQNTTQPIATSTDPVLVHKDSSSTATPHTTTHSLNDDDDQQYTAFVDKAAPAIEDNNSGIGHRFVLDQSELMQADVATEEDPQDNHNDDPLNNIRLKPSVEEEPVSPISKSFTTPAQRVEERIETASNPMEPIVSEDDAIARAARIKRMYDLLHNNPQGPDIVENQMREAPNSDAFSNCASDASECVRSSVDAFGKIISNANGYVFDNPD